MQQIPVPYIIEPPNWGAKTYAPDDELRFHMVLIGPALAQLPLIILAWRRALLRGVGPAQGKAQLLRVDWLRPEDTELPIYTEQAPIVVPHQPCVPTALKHQVEDFHLQMMTPLRIQQKAKVLGANELQGGILLRNIIRRTSLMLQLYLLPTGCEPSAKEEIHRINSLADNLIDERRLAWQEWARYSSRQKQKMNLGGVAGHWLLKAVPPELYPYLYLGQWLHVGKEIAFGLGQYQLVPEPWQAQRQTSSKKAASTGAL